jgi:hypothetical protein
MMLHKCSDIFSCSRYLHSTQHEGCYSGVTVVSQWCQNGVTGVSQWCDSDVKACECVCVCTLGRASL